MSARLKLKPAAVIAWARVSVLLSRDEVDEATRAAVAASELTGDWDALGPWACLAGPDIWASEHMLSGWVWFEPAEDRMLINRGVMAEYALSGRVSHMARVLAATMTTPGFRRYDLAAWDELRMDEPSTSFIERVREAAERELREGPDLD